MNSNSPKKTSKNSQSAISQQQTEKIRSIIADRWLETWEVVRVREIEDNSNSIRLSL